MPTPNQTIDLHELFQHVLLEIRATWRYRWHALAIAWGVLIVGAIMVFSLPNQYQASAEVYADTDALTNPLLRGIAVQPDVRARLAVITQTMLSRPNLETVADQTGLSLRATSPSDKDELLTALGRAVKIKDAGARNLYDITYTDRDPAMAQKVVQAFLQILMNDTLGANSSTSESAQTFLKAQVADYNHRLNELDKNLAEFRKNHIGFMPGPTGNDSGSQLQIAEARLQELQAEYAGAASGRAPVLRQSSPQIVAIDKQIAGYQQQLQTLLLNYTEQYPGVISAKRAIADLETQRAKLLKDPGATTIVVPSVGGPDVGGARRGLAAQIAAQRQQIATLKANADKIAETQVRYQQLTRNYGVTQKQYDELASRLNQAEMSQDATQSGNNLKFRIVSPPIVPLTPAGPHRVLMLLAAFLMALGIGAAFAYFLHKIKPVFVSLGSLRKFGGYPVIGSFGLVESETRRSTKHREVVGYCTGVGLLGLFVVVGIAFSGPIASLMQHIFIMGAT